MKKDIKILFLGAKKIGCLCLKYLLDSGENVVALITNPNDKGLSTDFPLITDVAKKYRLKVFKPKNINKEVKLIKKIKPDLILVAYYDQILIDKIIKIPKMGCINIHMAPSEKYRGCHLNNWAIINGDKEYGTTIHYIDAGIDTGNIIAEDTFTIPKDYTARDLYLKVIDVSFNLFKNVWPMIKSGNIKSRKQRAKGRYYKRSSVTKEIIFDKVKGEDIYNKIRGTIFPPFPGPYFYIGKKKYVIVSEGSLKK